MPRQPTNGKLIRETKLGYIEGRMLRFWGKHLPHRSAYKVGIAHDAFYEGVRAGFYDPPTPSVTDFALLQIQHKALQTGAPDYTAGQRGEG